MEEKPKTTLQQGHQEIVLVEPTARKTRYIDPKTELQTDQDRWLYMLKNLENLDHIPLAWSDKPEFVKLLEIAEVSNLTPEEMTAYEHDLKMLRDEHNTREYAIEQGIEAAVGAAVEAAVEAANDEKATEVAFRLKQKGVSYDIIVEATDLTLEQIEKL
ncbi:hypothetical protein GO495_06695 [Chitinophaga oryziterrae]|uniref:Transposase n=1 Tax=Chitinophaga oryziterrae TaxID=1031224 RepID=A0A6N8J5E0_9BACT|nr:PD-(D/E)XK nuclease family transposase [Chitinophaga oryziterrae]MVT40263.1 hypothetical protein [Chitinophaga oryziterrae]